MQQYYFILYINKTQEKKIKPIILNTKNVEIKMTNYHQKLIEKNPQKVASFQTKFQFINNLYIKQ